MKNLILFAFLFFTVACFGQTKLIAHRSHSGSNASFRTALEQDLFDLGNSNFGIVPQKTVDAIDSVILKPNGYIVVLRKRYTVEVSTNKQYHKVYMADTLVKKDGRVFLKANSIEGLKAQVKKLYGLFKTDSIQFIGFDKQLLRNKLFQKNNPGIYTGN